MQPTRAEPPRRSAVRASAGALLETLSRPLSQSRSGPADAPLRWLANLGLAWSTLSQCLGHYGAVLIGRDRLDLPALADALRQAGLSILLPVTLVTAALGVILGRQAASALESINLPGMLLAGITYAVVMELVPLLVGVLVGGRAGIALAVRHATLVVTGQMDGLLVMGVNPIRFITAPVLLAMLMMSFALLVWGSLVTIGAAYVWMGLFSEVPPYQMMDAVRQTLGPDELREAVSKPLVFAVVIALIATVNGSIAGRDPDAIGDAATRTMIGAVTAILLIDLLYVLWPEG